MNQSREAASVPEALLSRIRIVLCRPSHPGNIGAAARAMKNMGVSRLALVSPKRFPDTEADARAAGATDVLESALICNTLDEALAGVSFAIALSARSRDLGPQPVQARQAIGELLAALEPGEHEVALVFGNETVGLSNEEVSRCQLAAMIPSDPAFSSLNLGAAVQVLCYEARLQAFGGQPAAPGEATPFTSPTATLDEVEGFFAHLERVMTDTGFYNPAFPGRLMAKIRRLFGRARLEKEEINILRGILAATQQKTGHGKRHQDQ